MAYTGSKAIATNGSTLSVADSSGTNYLAIGEINDAGSMTGDKANKIDVTNLDSTGFKEYKQGLKDPPEATVKMNFISTDAGQQRLQELYGSGATNNFKLVLSDKITASGTTIIRSGYISGYEILPVKDGVLTLTVKIQFTGAPTITAAS